MAYQETILNSGKKMQSIINKAKAKNPYPEDIFTEPTHEEWLQVQRIFKDAGLIQDKFFGAFGRKVWVNCIDTIEQLIQKKETERIYEIIHDAKNHIDEDPHLARHDANKWMPKTMIDRQVLKQSYKGKSKNSMGSQCLAGYPGLTFTALQIANFIPKCKVYCEPLAGLGRVAKHIKADKVILNDKAEYAIKYLRKNFRYAEVTRMDYLECIDKYDSEETFFLIDPPYRTSAYSMNDLTFIDRTDTQYFTEIRDLLPKLKGDFILCSDSSRTGANIFKETNFYKNTVLSKKKIFGQTSKILLISNKPFIRLKFASLETWDCCVHYARG